MGKTLLKPRVGFVYTNPHEDIWLDGLWAALNLLSKKYSITKHNLHTGTPRNLDEFDFLLAWGAFGSEADNVVRKEGGTVPKGLCIAGNATPPSSIMDYDVLFHETKWYRKEIGHHPNIYHAFGVNTDIFNKVSIPTPIVWDYIGVGAFAKWKRWELMESKKGVRLVVGYYQDNNEQESLEIVRNLLLSGVMVSNQINPYDLATLYSYARTAYVPSTEVGGGERTVLEARACGLNVEIEPDNMKLKELLNCPIYDHKYYAKQLEEGILSCL